ncbi:hypothetical protein FF38_05201, partial [Lucilia cuprina]
LVFTEITDLNLSSEMTEIKTPTKRRVENVTAPPERRRRIQRPSSQDNDNLLEVNINDDCNDSDLTQTKGFSVGALIGMRLVDFQVAVDSTYKFDSSLNMILGSNGSGKSTIITAIFLLFKGRIADLDRKHYQDFVRHGCDRAVISAQLQGMSMLKQPNPKLTMVIPTNGGSNRNVEPIWYLNGKLLENNEVDDFINQYHIQVNNLCQFLPQHRVSAFSNESKQQRLLSTEEAVGYDGMLADHKKLSKVGNDLVILQSDISELEKSKSHFENSKNELEERVTAMERAASDRNREILLSHVESLVAKAAYDDRKSIVEASLTEAKTNLQKFDQDYAKYIDAIK